MFEKDEMLSSDKTLNDRIKYAASHIDELSDIEVRHLYEEINKPKMRKSIIKRAKYLKRMDTREANRDRKRELREEIAKVKRRINVDHNL